MTLESLPNEFLLEIFEFLDGIHLLHSFHGLNKRFNVLLFVHFRHYRLNFRSISKRNFDQILRQYLPLIIDRIISLSLSNNDETPNLVTEFLTYGFALNQFTQLQSLSLFYMDSIEQINSILNQSSYPNQLINLTLISCCSMRQNDLFELINNIWHLPKLKYCSLVLDILYNSIFSKLTTVSRSIEFFSVKYCRFYLKDLINLFKLTPQLRHLHATLFSDLGIDSLVPQKASFLISLNINILASHSALIALLKNTPNLRRLTIDTSNIFLNGHVWQQLITDYLPHIEIFRLYMEFKLTDENRRTEEIDQLLDTFRTSFWLEEHQWFVRCEWNLSIENDSSILYTLPYYIDRFSNQNQNQQFKLTTLHDHQMYWSYNSVRSISLASNDIYNYYLYPIRFTNLHSLHIELPTYRNIDSVIPTLNNLTSLTVVMYKNTVESELQTLINRAPRLYRLTFDLLSLDLLPIVLNITSTSIRRLDLFDSSFSSDFSLNASQSSMLINSPLGRQCEVLSVSVTDRSNILELINKMSNIRSLIYLCKEDENKGNRSRRLLSSSNKDELVEWLQEHLPSSSSIRRIPSINDRIEIWINKTK